MAARCAPQLGTFPPISLRTPSFRARRAIFYRAQTRSERKRRTRLRGYVISLEQFGRFFPNFYPNDVTGAVGPRRM